MFFKSKERNKVETGAAFRKTSGLASVWIVDKMLEYVDLPAHVRLVEQGGNERTITIALEALLDERSWKPMDTQV